MQKIFFALLMGALTGNASAQGSMAELVKPPIDSNILIVVNGRSAGTLRELKKDINNMFPADMIERIDVLKGPNKYGERGKAGVIEIYLKNVTITEMEDPTDSIRTKVDIEAGFPGELQAWRRYLERSLNGHVPADNGAPEGTYTVIIQFVVDRNGKVSGVTPLTNHGYGMEVEAMRVISKGPDWVPAIQNGRTVKAYRKQPITFVIINETWFRVSVMKIPAGKPTLIEILDMDNLKDDEIEVSISPGTITHDSGKKYIVMVDKPGKASISIIKKAKKKKDQMDYGAVEITVE